MADQDMVTLTIEGVEVTVPKGTMVIEAAKQAGVLIPHYCYHPGLPVAGVCRMCLVEIDGAPKLQIGCATAVTEGQNVKVYSDEAKKARKSVLEFLLINHPLDCPICDQAGECELQDFVFQEGRSDSRYGEFNKRFDPVEDFGPDVLYVANRCILCTRCVRFMDHIADEPVLNVSERGDRAFIGVHPDQQLDHAWAGNVVDLCPVGSLISKDFLHKARAWELDRAASVCTGCSQGCNVYLDTRDNIVVRARPRANEEVNRYFMCDHGRQLYRGFNRGDRIEAPLVAKGKDLQATDWDHALDEAARALRGVKGDAVVLASPNTSNEALFLAKEVVKELNFNGAFRVERVEGEQPLPGVMNLALREERAANVKGAQLLGYKDAFDDSLGAAANAAVLIVLGDALEGVSKQAVASATSVIYFGSTLTDAARAANVVLPISNVAEEDGTFVNRDGRVQRYQQAKVAPGMGRPAWWALGALAEAVHGDEAPIQVEEVFDRMVEQSGTFSGLSYAKLGWVGTALDKAGVSA